MAIFIYKIKVRPPIKYENKGFMIPNWCSQDRYRQNQELVISTHSLGAVQIAEKTKKKN